MHKKEVMLRDLNLALACVICGAHKKSLKKKHFLLRVYSVKPSSSKMFFTTGDDSVAVETLEVRTATAQGTGQRVRLVGARATDLWRHRQTDQVEKENRQFDRSSTG